MKHVLAVDFLLFLLLSSLSSSLLLGGCLYWCTPLWPSRLELCPALSSAILLHTHLERAERRWQVRCQEACGLPVGCPPSPSGSLPPHQCDVVGAKHLLVLAGWLRRPWWSNVAGPRKPARGPRSSRWKRPPSLSPWRWLTAGRGRPTGCQPEPPPAWGYPPLPKRTLENLMTLRAEFGPLTFWFYWYLCRWIHQQGRLKAKWLVGKYSDNIKRSCFVILLDWKKKNILMKDDFESLEMNWRSRILYCPTASPHL